MSNGVIFAEGASTVASRVDHLFAFMVVVSAAFSLLIVALIVYFAIRYPSPDGDDLKATYMLTTAPAWALCFGFALDRLFRDRWVRSALVLVLIGSTVLDLGFVIFESPVAGVF